MQGSFHSGVVFRSYTLDFNQLPAVHGVPPGKSLDLDRVPITLGLCRWDYVFRVPHSHQTFDGFKFYSRVRVHIMDSFHMGRVTVVTPVTVVTVMTTLTAVSGFMIITVCT